MGLDATLSGTISYFHYAGVGRSIAYYPRGGRRAPLGKASWFLVLGELASLILYFGGFPSNQVSRMWGDGIILVQHHHHPKNQE